MSSILYYSNFSYNIPFCFKTSFGHKEIKNALLKLLQRHEILRTVYVSDESFDTKQKVLSNMDEKKGWPILLETCNLLNKKKFDFTCMTLLAVFKTHIFNLLSILANKQTKIDVKT